MIKFIRVRHRLKARALWQAQWPALQMTFHATVGPANAGGHGGPPYSRVSHGSTELAEVRGDLNRKLPWDVLSTMKPRLANHSA
jgi:hypothetical protein